MTGTRVTPLRGGSEPETRPSPDTPSDAAPLLEQATA
eukprot:CAMPEP_0177761214 /NCGR_PEP_ID=MMETSP0491_2-20121128/5685_1 /TAXON_ID=63592 /ORGANISM="Tetraselmis chuii, Strain PLY429" /LENGTH=36 /DNA_ID= /DNA_START= /DNA_END= /DNA_ORIENTATION=